MKSLNKKAVYGIMSGCVAFVFLGFAFSAHNSYDYVAAVPASFDEVEKEEVNQEMLHIETPEQVKAIYMTSCVAGTPSFREKLVSLINETEINSVMIDIKDYTGTISYNPSNEELRHMWENARCGTSDMKEFIKSLHYDGIYVIGRVTVFQDPHLTSIRPDLAVKFASTGEVWKDHKGLSFTDVSAKEVWDYHIAIAKDAYGIGFDEINFDYIRFPSDGPMDDIYFPFSKDTPKAVALEKFFAYLHENLKETGMVTSADIFGMTTTNTDDLNIGQVLERVLPYFDYVAPMVYPSHYPKDFNGWSNPNDYPHEVVEFAMASAVKRSESTVSSVETLYTEYVPPVEDNLETLEINEARDGYYKKPSFSRDKLRTWIQDFDYGGDYGPEEVRAQIEASYDAGVKSFMIWDPGNTYTREALKNDILISNGSQ